MDKVSAVSEYQPPIFLVKFRTAFIPRDIETSIKMYTFVGKSVLLGAILIRWKYWKTTSSTEKEVWN